MSCRTPDPGRDSIPVRVLILRLEACAEAFGLDALTEALLCQIVLPEHYGELRRPAEPTDAEPGSEAKRAVMLARVGRGESPCHPGDARFDAPEPALSRSGDDGLPAGVRRRGRRYLAELPAGARHEKLYLGSFDTEAEAAAAVEAAAKARDSGE